MLHEIISSSLFLLLIFPCSTNRWLFFRLCLFSSEQQQLHSVVPLHCALALRCCGHWSPPVKFRSSKLLSGMDGSAGEQLNLPPFAPFSSLWGVSRSQTKHARHHHHHCHSHCYVLQTPQHIFNGQKKEQEHEEEDRKTDNPSACRTRVMTLQTQLKTFFSFPPSRSCRVFMCK